AVEPAGGVDLARVGSGAGNLGQALDFLFGAALEAVEVDVGFAQDRGSQARLLVEQGDEQMLDVHLLLSVAQGAALSVGQGFLGLLGEAINVHQLSPDRNPGKPRERLVSASCIPFSMRTSA